MKQKNPWKIKGFLAEKERFEFSYPEMEQFIEMCFDPKSKMNKRLKETLRQMMKEQIR